MTSASQSAVHSKDNLRRLTRLIGAALVFFGALLIIVVAYAGWAANRNAVLRERQQVENTLDDGVSRVLDEQKSIAWWDDAVIHIAHGPIDYEWADTEFGAWLSETYGHDEIFVLNGRNEPVYAYVDGARVEPGSAYSRHRDAFAAIVAEARHEEGGGALRTRARAFSAGQGNYRELLGATNAGWSGHILRVDGSASVVAAITIVPSVDGSLLRGEPFLLVSVVDIDRAFMGELGATLLLPDLALSETPKNTRALTSEPFAADNGEPLGHLVWSTKQPGQVLLIFILPLVVLGVTGAGAFSAHMLRRLRLATNDLALREARARHDAEHDALSGLANRHHFVEVLAEQLQQQTWSGEGAVVAYIDVDRFKDINDTLGHHAGDELIKAVASRLQTHLSSHDFLARFGGDEFAVMRAPTDLNGGDELADRLRAAFAEPFTLYGQHVRMTASVGLAMAPDHGHSTEELMRHADIALYEAKKNGRDRAMFFSANMAWDVERRRGIEVALREAIEQDELRLHYQPLVSANTGRITGVEALLRWRHPTRGDISPAVFVPIAEEAGIMPALGAWVLERAMVEAKQWPDLQVSINLSPVQFRHVDLEALLRELTAKHDVDPRRFVLEITEGVLLESTTRTRQTLDGLRAMGFKTALDDFGTGYSSLSYLCDFKFDKIKIDRAFVQGISAAKQSMTVIQAVVTIGRGLGMEIVAEGVETEAEASVLRLAGCHEIQGFFYSKPVPPEAVAGLVTAFAAEAARQEEAPAQVRRRFMRPVSGAAEG